MPQRRGAGLGQLTRMLNNFWTAVFEQSGPARQNAPIREVITLHDSVAAVEDQSAITHKIPNAVYYADLGQEGSDQLSVSSDRWGATGLNNYMWFEIPSWPSPQDFWVAMRVEILSAHDAAPTENRYLFGAEVSLGSFHMYYDGPNIDLIVQHASETYVKGAAFEQGFETTLIALFDSNEFGLSIHGTEIETAPVVDAISFLQGGTFYIGRGEPEDASSTGAEAAFLWCVMGIGPLTNQMADDLHNNTPDLVEDWEDLPASIFTKDTRPIMLWPGVDNTHMPSRYGEVEYWSPFDYGGTITTASGSASGAGSVSGDAEVITDFEFGNSQFDTGTFG